MEQRIKSLFIFLHSWQIVLFSVIGAVLITNLITVLFSYWIWHELQLNLIILATINAIIVPVVILPRVIRVLRKMIRLEEQNQSHQETILQLEKRKQMDFEIQQRADEMSLLYQISMALISGDDLYHALRAFVKKIKDIMIVDAFHIGLYDVQTDLFTYSLFLNLGEDLQLPPRNLRESPGLTWDVISSRRMLYLPDIEDSQTQLTHKILIVRDAGIRSYVGIPLMLQDRVIGLMSVQSRQRNAYNADQLRLLETVAAQVATTLEKGRLLDQLQKELEERKQIEASLRQRESILESVTFAAEQFLKTSYWRENID